MRRPACGSTEAGWTIAEILAALTILSIGMTASFSVFYRVRAMDGHLEQAALRLHAAERAMERTLALPFDEIASRRLALEPSESGGRRGWTADLRVREVGASLKSIMVIVTGEGRRTELATLVAREGRTR